MHVNRTVSSEHQGINLLDWNGMGGLELTFLLANQFIKLDEWACLVAGDEAGFWFMMQSPKYGGYSAQKCCPRIFCINHQAHIWWKRPLKVKRFECILRWQSDFWHWGSRFMSYRLIWVLWIYKLLSQRIIALRYMRNYVMGCWMLGVMRVKMRMGEF